MSIQVPQYVRNEFREGLDLYQHGRGGKGLKAKTIREAREIVSGKPISLDKLTRMRAWFARHYVDKRPGWNKLGQESPGYTAWQLWGGDRGRSWAKRRLVMPQMENPYAGRWASYHKRMLETAGQAARGQLSREDAEYQIRSMLIRAKADYELPERDFDILRDATNELLLRMERKYHNPMRLSTPVLSALALGLLTLLSRVMK